MLDLRQPCRWIGLSTRRNLDWRWIQITDHVPLLLLHNWGSVRAVADLTKHTGVSKINLRLMPLPTIHPRGALHTHWQERVELALSLCVFVWVAPAPKGRATQDPQFAPEKQAAATQEPGPKQILYDYQRNALPSVAICSAPSWFRSDTFQYTDAFSSPSQCGDLVYTNRPAWGPQIIWTACEKQISNLQVLMENIIVRL